MIIVIATRILIMADMVEVASAIAGKRLHLLQSISYTCVIMKQ